MIKSRNRSTSRTREKEEKQKPTQHTSTKTKNKSRNIESMETEIDSTPKIGKRPGGTFKLSPAKFDAVSSSSRAKSPMGIDKQSNAQGTSKSLQRSYSIESMDSDTDRIVASLDLEGITNNYKTGNHLTVCKQMNSILFKCHLQTIHFKSKNKITDQLISHISCIFI